MLAWMLWCAALGYITGDDAHALRNAAEVVAVGGGCAFLVKVSLEIFTWITKEED